MAKESGQLVWVDYGFAGTLVTENQHSLEVELFDAAMFCFGIAGDSTLTGEVRQFPRRHCHTFSNFEDLFQHGKRAIDDFVASA